MGGHLGFWDVEDRLARLSGLGDQLEAFATVVDFETFRVELEAALDYGDSPPSRRASPADRHAP